MAAGVIARRHLRITGCDCPGRDDEGRCSSRRVQSPFAQQPAAKPGFAV
ncbi:MAG: hypothetical protein WBY93_05770 [Candidatus Binatus sp.]